MNKFICDDSIHQLKRMPDKSIDLLCTDPPYGINIAKGGKIGTGRLFTKKDWDSSVPSREYFDEMRRVSKRQIIWGGNYFAHLLPASQCWLVWWKKDGLPRGTIADCELAWTSFKTPAQVFNSRWHGFIQDSKEPRVAHPTHKALAVMKWCIAQFSEPRELILDPFVGSGTTLVAAQMLGRRCVGIECDKEYIDIARSRMASV